ncbi:MAG: hypothetical protein AAGA75_21790 [Cyanobacteria bacterium P01_E01_bin.6]
MTQALVAAKNLCTPCTIYGLNPPRTSQSNSRLPDRLAALEKRRNEILREGMAPTGAWIEVNPCYKRNSKQAIWRSPHPIFDGKKRKYIGMEGSRKHAEARAERDRRHEYKRITREIEELSRER